MKTLILFAILFITSNFALATDNCFIHLNVKSVNDGLNLSWARDESTTTLDNAACVQYGMTIAHDQFREAGFFNIDKVIVRYKFLAANGKKTKGRFVVKHTIVQ